MTFEKRAPFPGEHSQFRCDFCDNTAESAQEFQAELYLPAGWREVGEDRHVCPTCQNGALLWALDQMRKAPAREAPEPCPHGNIHQRGVGRCALCREEGRPRA